MPVSPSKDQDADLADLLGNGNGSLEMEKLPLNQKSPNIKNNNNPPMPTLPSIGGLCACISAHLSYLCFAYPSACGMLACLLCLFVLTWLVAHFINPTQNFGVLSTDWTTISSVYELEIAKIDHWCLGGGNEGCRCEDPLVPTSRAELRAWTEAYKDNIRMIDKYLDDDLIMADLDVAIVGESAVEEMDGRWLGRFRNDELKSIGTIFRNHFDKSHGADVEGEGKITNNYIIV